MIASFEHLLWSLLSYLKTLLFTLFTGVTLSPPAPIKKIAYHEKRNGQQPSASPSPDAIISRIAGLKDTHETFALLHDMIATDGAGSWPPRCSSSIDAWPAALRPYHEIYLELAPQLSVPEASLNDEENKRRRASYRARMRALFDVHVDLPAIEALLSHAEAGDEDAVPAEVYNGFLACIAMSRHAYRWATIPAVKVGQLEKRIAYPAALTLPWAFLQRRYDFYSPAGNAMSNFVMNWDSSAPASPSLPGGRLAYPINVGRSPTITRTEHYFAYMFLETERLSVPVYADVAACLHHYHRHQPRDRAALLASLRRVRDGARAVAKMFYENMTSDKVAVDVWLAYVQGFHAYGAAEEGEEEVDEYDGVSGNQLPFFQVLDAFLGVGRGYVSAEERKANVPGRQRAFVEGVRRACFRQEVRERDPEVEALMREVAMVVRVWRAAHRVRIVPYLEQPAPERLIMTAGKSVLETKGLATIKAATQFINSLLAPRVQEAV